MTDPATLLLIARGLLFASAGELAGALLFELSVAPLPQGRRLLLWGGWAAALLAAVLWLFAQAARFGHRALAEVVSSGVLSITVTRTRFGHVMMVELVLVAATALALAAAALMRRRASTLALLPAAGMLATLAWTGHGGDDRGLAGVVHLAADTLHLLGMGAWLGGLLPLALLIAAAQRYGETEAIVAARKAIWRFSSRCLWAVGVLAVAGSVNAWFLIGSLAAFVTTAYGQLLLIKIGVFLVMFTLAAVNREILIPRLSGRLPGDALVRVRNTLPGMVRNTLLIAALAIAVIGIAARLGTLPPALHDMSQMPNMDMPPGHPH